MRPPLAARVGTALSAHVWHNLAVPAVGATYPRMSAKCAARGPTEPLNALIDLWKSFHIFTLRRMPSVPPPIRPACSDPFEYMRVDNKTYAFRRQDPGMGWVDFGQAENFWSYETNFDLVKVTRFRTPEMTAFLDELARDPKRSSCAVYMFLDVAKEVHEMCEMPYAQKDYI
ncbi:hypothetical protein B0H19DRAFT_1063447 [Mycena capillaripes]|nr:hypothetical protein B0H19DRAFT_1063447 [Mycena capillaripes]